MNHCRACVRFVIADYRLQGVRSRLACRDIQQDQWLRLTIANGADTSSTCQFEEWRESCLRIDSPASGSNPPPPMSPVGYNESIMETMFPIVRYCSEMMPSLDFSHSMPATTRRDSVHLQLIRRPLSFLYIAIASVNEYTVGRCVVMESNNAYSSRVPTNLMLMLSSSLSAATATILE